MVTLSPSHLISINSRRPQDNSIGPMFNNRFAVPRERLCSPDSCRITLKSGTTAIAFEKRYQIILRCHSFLSRTVTALSVLEKSSAVMKWNSIQFRGRLLKPCDKKGGKIICYLTITARKKSKQLTKSLMLQMMLIPMANSRIWP